MYYCVFCICLCPVLAVRREVSRGREIPWNWSYKGCELLVVAGNWTLAPLPKPLVLLTASSPKCFSLRTYSHWIHRAILYFHLWQVIPFSNWDRKTKRYCLRRKLVWCGNRAKSWRWPVGIWSRGKLPYCVVQSGKPCFSKGRSLKWPHLLSLPFQYYALHPSPGAWLTSLPVI